MSNKLKKEIIDKKIDMRRKAKPKIISPQITKSTDTPNSKIDVEKSLKAQVKT